MNPTNVQSLKVNLKSLKADAAKLARLAESSLNTINRGRSIKETVSTKIAVLEERIYAGRNAVRQAFRAEQVAAQTAARAAELAKAPKAPAAPAPAAKPVQSALSGC